MATSVDGQHRSPEVADAAVADAVEVLRDRLDVLLDRLTDTVLGTPIPGSARWRAQFDTPDAVTRAVRADSRATVRAMIAERAGVVDPAASQSMPPRRDAAGVSRRGRRTRIDPAQLPIF